MGRRWALWLDLAVKAALVGLLLFAVARPDLPQFHGKAMVARALLYPISALIVPVVWWLRRRPRPWDDLNHFVNWAFLVAAFGQLLLRLPVGRWEAFGLAVGFGCVTAVLWEFAEYFTFIRNSPELRTAYTDTLGDLALGLAGSTLAAVLTVTVLWPTRVRPAASRAGAH